MENGNRWKALLDELGMNQTEFAAKIGIGKSHVSKLVSGQTEGSDLLLFAVEKKCSVRRQWLETGEGPVFSDESDARRRVMELAEKLNDEQAKAVSAFIRCLQEEGL